MTRSSLGSTALALLVAGCSGAQAPVPGRTFEPGIRVTVRESLRVELLEARYDDRQITLQVRLTNAGSEPVSVGRTGLLLAYGELEFPVDTELAPTLGDTVAVPPRTRVELELPFSTGGRVVQRARLLLRSVQTDDGTWIDGVELPIPPSPAVGQDP